MTGKTLQPLKRHRSGGKVRRFLKDRDSDAFLAGLNVDEGGWLTKRAADCNVPGYWLPEPEAIAD